MTQRPGLHALAVRAALALMSGGLVPAGAAEPLAAGGTLFYSSDSESFSSRRTSADLMGSFSHLDGKTGLRYIDHHYSRGDWSRSGQQLRFVTHHIDRKTADGWLLETGVLRQGTHQLLTLDASYRKTVSPATSIEAFASRDIVETRNALDLGTRFNFAGLAVDQRLTSKLTAVGLAGWQAFSDDNQRRHLRARLIYQPSLDLGLTLQLRYRYFDSSKNDVAGAYFNPSRYDETLLAVGWRQRAGDWRTAITAGAGVQQVNRDDRSGTRLLEATAERQMAGYALRVRAGYSRAAAAAATDPDYWYRYAAGELIFPF